ncbi:hypothetical protein QBC41DRAFT_238788, partial [Cercophora samala]
ERFRELIRINPPTFFGLVTWFKTNTAFKNNNSVAVEEKLLIFLIIVANRLNKQIGAFKFRRSTSTIHRLTILYTF